MLCHACDTGDLRVTDTRYDGVRRYRRRRCTHCNVLVSTTETVDTVYRPLPDFRNGAGRFGTNRRATTTRQAAL